MTGDKLRIGFLGAGKMATALARGWLKAGLVSAEEISASDSVPAARAAFTQETGSKCSEDNLNVVKQSELVVLAVKPQNMGELLSHIAQAVTAKHLIISIAAGVTLASLTKMLGQERRLVRVMPNTPCLVSASASAYSAGSLCTPQDVEVVSRLLSAVGRAFALPEKLLDAVTGLSGSGPAYVFLMIEALSDGGVRTGLPRDVATQLAAQTVYGAAKMLIETGMSPSALKDMVTSPGGTTIAGLHAMESGGVRAALMDAVVAATERSIELGKK